MRPIRLINSCGNRTIDSLKSYMKRVIFLTPSLQILIGTGCWHGRSDFQIEEIDCFRRINAIASFCVVAKQTKEQLRQLNNIKI